MLPSHSKSWRCEYEAFVRCFRQISRVEDVSTCLRRSSSTAQSVSTHAKHNSKASARKGKITWNHQFHCAPISRHARSRPHPSRTRAYFSPQPKLRLSEKTQCFLQILTFKWHPWCIRTKLSCEASVKLQELRYENEAFVRCFRQISRIRRCENDSFVRCFHPIPRVEEAFVRYFLQIAMLYSILLCSTLLQSIVVLSTLLSSALICSSLLSSTLPCSPLRCFALLYSTLCYSALIMFSTCELDTMIFVLWWSCSAGANWTQWSLFSDDDVKVRDSEFLYETSFDKGLVFVLEQCPAQPCNQVPNQQGCQSKRGRQEWWDCATGLVEGRWQRFAIVRCDNVWAAWAIVRIVLWLVTPAISLPNFPTLTKNEKTYVWEHVWRQ